MNEPFLILHKVRGEPAFDIAIKLCDGPAPCQPNCGRYPGCKEEPWWIIPTSGHRAYPYWHTSVCTDGLQLWFSNETDLCHWNLPPMPEGLPDHYAVNDRPTTVTTTQSVADLLTQLGLVQPINRRA